MNSLVFRLKKPLIMLAVLFAVGFAADNLYAQRSVIQGFVFDKQRNALPDVDVELLNEYYQVRGRTRTDGAGRYSFTQLPDGYYTIRVMPFRYDLEDEERLTEIRTIDASGRGGGVDYKPEDFYLQPKKGGIADSEIGVIFAQEVPNGAREAYKQALKDLEQKRNQEGIEGLFKATQIFPEYYDALYRLGKELYVAGKYEHAWQFLLKSTEINPKSGHAFYYLGNSFHKLGKGYEKVSVRALTEASVLLPNSMRVFYSLGVAERAFGKFGDAEKHLQQAKKMANKPLPEIQKELVELYEKDLKDYAKAADELEVYMKSGKMTEEEKKSTKAIIDGMREKAKAKSNS